MAGKVVFSMSERLEAYSESFATLSRIVWMGVEGRLKEKGRGEHRLEGGEGVRQVYRRVPQAEGLPLQRS